MLGSSIEDVLILALNGLEPNYFVWVIKFSCNASKVDYSSSAFLPDFNGLKVSTLKLLLRF
jgi:hypothetical protein